MRRTLISTALVALAAGPLMLGSAATAAPAAGTATSVSVTDRKNDVLTSSGKKIRHNLDVRRVSAAIDGENVLVRLKVKDLRAGHLKADDLGGGYYQNRYALWTEVKFGKKPKWGVGWNAYPDATDAAADGPGAYECNDEQGYSRILQAANLKTDVLTFTLPIDCMPEKKTQLKVTGYVNWDTKKSWFSDKIGKTYGPLKFSPLLTFG